MWSDIALVAGKDLRLELRSRVGLAQVLPFAVVTLVLFALAIDPGRGVLERVAPGLYWVAVLLATVLAAGRAASLEADGGTRDLLRLSDLSPAAFFLGKALAIAVQLLALEVALGVGIVVLYDVTPATPVLLVPTVLAATAALASVGAVYGSVTAATEVRESLLPLLMLPVLAPVLIAATEATEAAVERVPSDGWGWAGLLALVAVASTLGGAATAGTLLEET